MMYFVWSEYANDQLNTETKTKRSETNQDAKGKVYGIFDRSQKNQKKFRQKTTVVCQIGWCG